MKIILGATNVVLLDHMYVSNVVEDMVKYIAHIFANGVSLN